MTNPLIEDIKSISASVNANSTLTCSSISAGTVLFEGQLQEKINHSKSPPESSKSDSPVAIAEQPTDQSMELSATSDKQPEKKKKKKKIIKKIKKVKKNKETTKECQSLSKHINYKLKLYKLYVIISIVKLN